MNDIAAIGHNDPPRTVFDEVADLHLEATAWLDGEAIENDAQAEALGMLMVMLTDAAKRCDEERDAKGRPFHEAHKAVQAEYKPHLDKAKLALNVAKKVRDKWLRYKQAIMDEQARIAREKAAEEKRIADEAMRASRGDLAAREQAEAMLEAAKSAEHKAIALAKAQPPAIGGRRTVSKKWLPQLTDASKAAAHYYRTRRGEMESLFINLAVADVRAGAREIPGFLISEEE